MAGVLQPVGKVVMVVALALLVGVPSGPVAAAPDDAASFKQHFERGQVHYDLKEYSLALDEFKSAYRFKQDPVMLYNIAQCHFFLGHNEEALGFYRNYLRRAPDASNKAAVERKIQEVERRLASGPKSPTPGPVPAAPPVTARPSPTVPPPPAAPSSVPAEPARVATASPPPLAPPAIPAEAAPSPVLAPPTLTSSSPPPMEERSLFSRWWFWTGVGVVVAGVVIGGVAASRRGQIGDCMGYSPCKQVGGP